jgi:hypothetical protein
MKVISTLKLVGAVIICGASISSTSASGQEYDPGDTTAPYNPNDPVRVPEVVVTASNPGNGCIVNYCYNGTPPRESVAYPSDEPGRILSRMDSRITSREKYDYRAALLGRAAFPG